MTPAVFRATLTTLGWSQRVLARRLGVSHITVQRYASGARTIPAGVAAWVTGLAACVAARPPPGRPRRPEERP